LSTPTVIILGGGFAGVKCARTLEKLLRGEQHRIVLFNRENHMVFHPLLAEVASAAVQPKDVAAPLRQLLKQVECRTEDVLNIDLDNKFIEYEAHNSERRHMPYDQLVIACGTDANLAIVPGMDEHAFGLKTIGDALALQVHVMEQLEKAEVCDDGTGRRKYLSFVVVGGGFSGVEMAGELNELVRRSLKFFRNISKEEVSVTIVQSRDQLLPEVSSSLRDFAKQRMEQSGVRILLNRQVIRATTEGVVLNDGTHLTSDTVVCTIGTTPSPLVKRLSVPKTNNRLSTESDMSLLGRSDAWAIGDCAANINACDNKLCPPVGQFAEQQGKQAAQNIYARMHNRSTTPFSYKMMGQLCSIGGRDAVAEIGGLKISGFVAWFLWRGIYLMKLPSIPQKIKVGIEWGCDLIFPRTLAHLKTDRSKRVKRAFCAENDWVFRQGEPATDFYMIQQGEVEVVVLNEGVEEVAAILGAGDFFGEGALLDHRARNASVRARTDLELVVLGRSVFAEISGALAPLKESLAKAMQRRRNVWANLEYLKEILESIPLEIVIDALPGAPLLAESTVHEAIERINKHKLDFCTVVSRDQSLIGIVTRSDLLRAIEVAASVPQEKRLEIPVSQIMVSDPVALSLEDSTLLAFATMRERGMKRLPVLQDRTRRIVRGYIRIEKIMDEVVQRLTGIQRQEMETSSAPTREMYLR
jgi:NADH dehydrogenase